MKAYKKAKIRNYKKISVPFSENYREKSLPFLVITELNFPMILRLKNRQFNRNVYCLEES